MSTRANYLKKRIKVWCAASGHIRYGDGFPLSGYLPVYSTDTIAEADRLVSAACQRDAKGDLIAREVAENPQDLEALYSFGERLATFDQAIREITEDCDQ